MKKELVQPQDFFPAMEARVTSAGYVDLILVNRPRALPCNRTTVSVHTFRDTREEGLQATPEDSKRIGEAIANLPELIKALQFVYQDNYDNLSVNSRMRIEEALESVL